MYTIVHRTFHNFYTLAIYILLLSLFTAAESHGASLKLTWDANTEANLAGYRVYYGASPGKYQSSTDAGNVIEYELSGLTTGETYYIALTAYDTFYNESDLSDEISVVAQISTDTTPPTGTITINSDNEVTDSPNVVLTLTANDAGKELGANALMTLSNDGQVWSDSEPYAATKSWILDSGNGVKTVYVKFRDASGNWMTEPAQDQITFEGLQITCDTPYQITPVSLSASSEFLFFQGENVADGDPLTLWSTIPSFFWGNESITLDLGEVKLIDSVEMFATYFFNTYFFPVNFQIEISKDKIDWKEIYTVRNYAPKTASSDSWDLNSVEGRYVRVYITKARIFLFFFYLTQIAEIEVYGCDVLEDTLTPRDKDLPVKEGTPSDLTDMDHGPPTTPGTPVISFF